MGDVLGDLAGDAKGLAGSLGSVAGTVASGVLDPVGFVGDSVRGKVAEELSGEAEKILWTLAQSFVDGTQVIFHFMVDLLLGATAPQVTGDFIYTMGGRMFFISLPLIVLFAAIRIIGDSLRAKALIGARDAFIGAGASVLGTIALLPLTSLAVRAVDSVADGLLTATLSDGDEFVDSVMEAVVDIGTVVGNMTADQDVSGPISGWQVAAGGAITCALICIVCSVLLLLACLVIGFALVARNMLLYIVIVVGPVCLSGLAWEPTRTWASKWMGWMVALIFTKLAIVVVMGLGVLAITDPADADSTDVLPILATMLSGILMLILAAFMPVACFALFGFMGEATVRELSMAGMGAQGMLTKTAGDALSAPQKAVERLSSVLGSGGPGGDQGLVPVGGPSGGPDGAGESDGGGSSTGGIAMAATAVGHPEVGLAVSTAGEVGDAGQGMVDGVADQVADGGGDAVAGGSGETGASGSGGAPAGEGAEDGGGVDAPSGPPAESVPADAGVSDPPDVPAGEAGGTGWSGGDGPVSGPDDAYNWEQEPLPDAPEPPEPGTPPMDPPLDDGGEKA
jgi:hypothetical protein